MKAILCKAATVLFYSSIVVMSHFSRAGLIDRGNGMIYDDVLDVTWLQNANLANKTMNWQQSITWADTLEYGGFDDWRLSTIYDVGNDGCNYTYNNTDCGYNSLTSYTDPRSGKVFFSELAYMFYENLHNIANYDVNGNLGPIGWDTLNTNFVDAVTGNTVNFTNLKRAAYWSATEYRPDASRAWYFYTYRGSQSHYGKNSNFYAWALRDGDIRASSVGDSGPIFSVPETSSIAIFTFGLLGLLRLKRK